MKKALQISLAKTLFTIEEDAYTRLESYLASVRKHFEKTAGYTEIINDIESRIAEQLIEGKHKIVTIEAIEKILASMGRVEDFDDGAEGSGTREEATTAAQSGKKLYRNPDDALIAGVCSGIATYMGWDTIWVRLAFILLTFFNGFGIMLYIILWIIMPEAKSASQKLEMAGSPVTIETLSETVRERFDEIKEDRRGTFRKIISMPARMIGAIAHLIAPILRIVIGATLVTITSCVLVAVLFTSGMLLSGNGFIASGMPISAILPGPLYVLALLNALIVILIPVLLMLLLSISMLKKRSIIPLAVWAPMLGTWLIALMLSGFTIAKVTSNYEAYTRTAPEYQTVTRDIPLPGPISRLEVSDGTAITVISGTTTALRVRGQEKNIDAYVTSVKNGTLSVSRAPSVEHFCIFCWNDAPELTLEIPSLDSIAASHGSYVAARDFDAFETVSVSISQGSRMEMNTDADTFAAEVAQGSYLTLEGSAMNATLTAKQGSRIDAEDFRITTAELQASYGSVIEAQVTKTLEAAASYGARISYDGAPKATVSEKQGGNVVSNDSEEE